MRTKKVWCQTVTKLREGYPHTGIFTLCKLFGKTRHAWYDAQWRADDQLLKDEIILQMVKEIRQSLPRIGTRKLWHLLESMLSEHKLEAGRDYLFDLLASRKLLIRRRKRNVVTTNSKHWMRKYRNLIKELAVTKPEQLRVSDITYIRHTGSFAYLSLVTDAYSRKITGCCLNKTLSAEGCLEALQMALESRTYLLHRLIHHSDRGSQYCSKEYVELLTNHNIAISMTENGDPYENAIAERINGILKTEFNLCGSSLSFEDTCQLVAQSIKAYNELRPHASCNYLTPQDAHRQTGTLQKRWKNYYQPAAKDGPAKPTPKP